MSTQRARERGQATISGRGRGSGQFHPPLPVRGVGRGGRGRPGGTIFMQDRASTVDARIKDDSDKAVVTNLHSSNTITADAQCLPLRPNFGTQGREISLRTNYFPVDVQGQIFLYSAEIVLSHQKNPNTLPRRLKQRVFRLAEKTADWQMLGHVAHDSAEKLVASIQLPEPLTIRGTFHDEEERRIEYTLTLTYNEEVDRQLLNECLAGKPVDSQALSKVLSALNLVLAAHPSQTGIKIGRDDDKKKHPDQRLFFNNPEPKDIGGGLAVRDGFYVSVRPGHQQLMVNVNTCHAGFYKPQNFANAMEEYHRLSTVTWGVSERNALEHRFKHTEHGWVTVARYYELQHKIKLDRPHLPLLKGSKLNVYPPEVCDILPDQGFKGELADKKHAKNMLDVACKPPKENADKIVNRGLDVLGFRANPLLESFGIHVGTEMSVVPGRILDKPGLSYSPDAASVVIDNRASWNLRDVKFAVGAWLDKWAVLVIQGGTRNDDFKDNKDPALRNIISGFRAMCNKSGMRVQPVEERAYAQVRLPPQGKQHFRDDAIKELERALTTLKKQVAPQLVLVMLPNEDKVIYNGLKWLCDTRLDIATVCMQSSKVKQEKGRQQYYANVALKVNMKMGGINHTLDGNSGAWLKSAPTMIMGMDVTHPPGKSSVDGPPSIVAIVASIDGHFAQYPAALAIRRGNVEIERREDNALRDMFISRFELYKARNRGDLPQRVILYRDGVSESQFMQVRKHELTEMQRAFEHFDSYRPTLSIVICGKRHNTRFYPTSQEDAALDGNPLPSTVVDRGVTPAYEYDFFLQAHGGLKGTTRPTHYFVVHDENKFSADELQRVTNDLSYMFARATKAVSLVSAAYWADIACERGRCYLYKLLQGGAGKEVGAEAKGPRKEKDTVFEQAERMWGGGVSGPRLRDTMYYL